MKGRINKPGHPLHGEIVTINSWGQDGGWIEISNDDYTSKKIEHLDYYHDIIPIEDADKKEVDWTIWRNKAAIAAMQSMLTNQNFIDVIGKVLDNDEKQSKISDEEFAKSSMGIISKFAVIIADCLLEELQMDKVSFYDELKDE